MTKNLHYQQQGSGADIILIHGLFGSLENLNMVAKGLKDNYRVTNIDVRNHGLSFHKNAMSYQELAQDVIELMARINIERAHILGHSMGGKIAMQLALDHSEKIDKLIIADIAPVAYPPHHTQIIEGLQNIKLDDISNRKDADNQLSPYVDDIGVRQFLLRNLVAKDGKFNFKCNLDNIQQCYPQIMAANQGKQAFKGETLFIKGGNSNYITTEHRDIIQALFPNSRAKIIQGTGHWLHAEKTTVFNKIVNEYLNL
ncbi:alpha/beta fold hydrolase [Colwellia hornerae]|uniref:Alpha/beta fold hydrolase n=1 Tax=Colwellia hornerae TaxID=89402 RepID=A0A5C6QM30_9GAMM|nr:alpha/beta fold hydrolase [Colwellia hornerae]TWX54593.1 alpha/beta fold hydrolase [Colwellia hornerae]TWX61033.1 alpha/beta fold hydrolase [Colwellia hornerae]TWX70286.1 alpha/beta fold hydrolase [Colwellia hornerae]